MRLRIGVVVAAFFALLAAGLLVTWIAELRVDSGRATCQNHLRELSLFAIAAAESRPDQKPVFASEREKAGRSKLAAKEFDRVRNLNIAPAIPAGTIPNSSLPHDRRLSWAVTLIPSLDQRRQDTSGLLASIDRAQAWDAASNQAAARTVIRGLLCPENPIEADPAVTQYVGAGGVGADAATLPHTAPTAGCFRYDAPTPLDAIGDGLSQSVLFAEVSANAGPWLRGGPATVRTLDRAKPAVGPGNQFGGNHAGGAYFGMADGASRFLTPRTDPAVLAALFTINGGPAEVPVD
jgi:hypothetical protein